MFFNKLSFVVLLLSVITVIRCTPPPTTLSTETKYSEDGINSLSSNIIDPLKLQKTNTKNQINDDPKQKLANVDKQTDLPLVTLLDEIFINPNDITLEQSFNKLVDEHNKKKLGKHHSHHKHHNHHNHHKLLINDYIDSPRPSQHTDQLGIKFSNSFGSSFDIDSILKHFGSFINPLDFLIPDVFGSHKPSGRNPLDNIGGVYVVEIGDKVGKTEISNKTPLTEKATPGIASVTENKHPASIKHVLDSFADTIKSLHETLRNLSLNNLISRERYIIPDIASNLNISIQSQGENQFIPSNAYVMQGNNGLLNITWKSEKSRLNNSLSLKLTQGRSGDIVFEYMNLRLLEDNEIHEFNLKEPVYVNPMNRNENETIVIKLTGKAGVKFINTGFMDFVTLQKTEQYSTQWLVFSIAVLGLIVASLVMLLSYIMYKKNKSYPRKESTSKEAIVY